MTFSRTIETTFMNGVLDISFMLVPYSYSMPLGIPSFQLVDICPRLGIGILAHFTEWDIHDVGGNHLAPIFAGLCVTPFAENAGDLVRSSRLSGMSEETLALLNKLNEIGASIVSASPLEELLSNDVIVVENSPPESTSFTSIVNSGSGAIIGAYTGYAARHGSLLSPLLLLLTVPAGILICASAMALAQALEHGLKSAISRLLVGDKKPIRELTEGVVRRREAAQGETEVAAFKPMQHDADEADVMRAKFRENILRALATEQQQRDAFMRRLGQEATRSIGQSVHGTEDLQEPDSSTKGAQKS